jgi:ubiquitin carboxyl-terminal hydrolase 7
MSYWYDSDRTQKIDDRFEFPPEIDLGVFLDEKADRYQPWKYKLYSVLAHSGDLRNGHFSAFIRPGQHAQWFKFDDERVTPVTKQEALEGNYGGQPLNDAASRIQAATAAGSPNARILVYIRETVIDQVLASSSVHHHAPAYLSKPIPA